MQQLSLCLQTTVGTGLGLELGTPREELGHHIAQDQRRLCNSGAPAASFLKSMPRKNREGGAAKDPSSALPHYCSIDSWTPLAVAVPNLDPASSRELCGVVNGRPSPSLASPAQLAGGGAPCHLVWFKCTDLRIHDHEPLAQVPRAKMISSCPPMAKSRP